MRTIPLGELLEKVIDHRGKTPKKLGTDFTSTGVPVASAQLVSVGELDLSEARCVDEDTWRRWMPVPLEPGDVLLTSEAPLGRVAWIESNNPLVLGQRLFALRVDAKVADSKYLGYWLMSIEGQSSLMAHATGSTVSGIRQSSLLKVEVPVADIGVQRAVGEVLGALDDKIAVNRGVNSLSLDLLITKYRAVAKRRETSVFEDVAYIGGGSTPSTKKPELWGQGVLWATPTDVTALDGIWLDRTARKISPVGLASISSPLYPAGSIAMTSRATIGACALLGEPMAVNQGFIVLQPKHSFLQLWLYCQLLDRVEELKAWANGATFLELPKKIFRRLPVELGDESDMDDFAAFAAPLMERLHALQRENRFLAVTRDELLPLLMSGKITVKEAEKTVEGVL